MFPIQSLRGTLESVERERQKLMKDFVATNQRVTVFAQDVDEQNARMEEVNKEKIRYSECPKSGLVRILDICMRLVVKQYKFWTF